MAMDNQPMITASAVTLLLLLALFFFYTFQAMAGPKCVELLKKRCQSCHSLTRTCAELGRDTEKWQQTIVRMADYASVITDKEQRSLVKCLAKQHKDVVDLCRQ